MKQFVKIAALAWGVVAAGGAASTAHAAGAPAGALTYVGTVTDTAGKPLAGTQVKVGVFGSATDDGSPALCSSKAASTDALGHFTAYLDKCDQAVRDNADLWTEVTVGKSNATVLPRQRLTPAAYALEAGSAANASGNLAAQLADLAKKVAGVLTGADLAPLTSALNALKGDVAVLKATPKVSAQVVNLQFGTGVMVETQAGTLTAQFSSWVFGEYSPASKPQLKIDGQAVGTLTVGPYLPNTTNGYYATWWVQGMLVAQVTAGKHFIEVAGIGTNNPTNLPVLFTLLP